MPRALCCVQSCDVAIFDPVFLKPYPDIRISPKMNAHRVMLVLGGEGEVVAGGVGAGEV